MAKVTYDATGSRKSSVARVRLVPGEGKIVLNGRELSEYFSLKTLELVVRQPLETTETLGKYDVTANVVGGGIAGQAGAVRHGIARALLNNPKLILADEPTGALDSTSGEQVMELFQKLNDEGVSVLMITHDPEIAAHAKRVVMIRDGELQEKR